MTREAYADREIQRWLEVFESSYIRHHKGESEQAITIYCDIVCAGTWPDFDTSTDHEVIKLACDAVDQKVPYQLARRGFEGFLRAKAKEWIANCQKRHEKN